jgi:DNA-binding NarL/FixJ family response regulator
VTAVPRDAGAAESGTPEGAAGESITPMKVVIAEDAALFREGLRRLLEDRGHHVAAAVAEPAALLAAVAEHQPDVVISSSAAPTGSSSISWLRRCSAASPP